jgi:hypothetical protein
VAAADGPECARCRGGDVRALRASGLSPEQIYGNLIAWHIQGIARTTMQDQEITRRTGVTNEAYWESRNSFWVTYFEPERFPTMSWIHEHGGFDGPEPADDFAFERVLDGIQTLVDRR